MMAGPVAPGRPVRCSSYSGVTMRPWRRTITGSGVFDGVAGRTSRYRRSSPPTASGWLVLTQLTGTAGAAAAAAVVVVAAVRGGDGGRGWAPAPLRTTPVT